MECPPELPPFNKYPALGIWLNKLRNYCASLRPLNSHHTLTQHTSVGVFRKGTPPTEEAESTGEPIWL